MTFVIDTGDTVAIHTSIGYLDGIAEAIEQMVDGNEARRVGATVQIVTAELRKPKRLDTVRRRWMSLWPVICPLAETYPAGFDELFLEYADRVTSLT